MYLDHPKISQRYFFPRAQPPPDIRWVESGGGRLACAFVQGPPGAPTLIHFHGNGEVVADYVGADGSHAFSAIPVSVLYAEYRGYGASEGEPSLVGMLEDVTAMLSAAGVEPERAVAFGRSVGSIYAIELAAREPRLGGLILESGIADVLERVLLRVRPDELGCDLKTLAKEAERTLDHRKKLGGFSGPFLAMHARRDDLVDVSHAERNHEWAGGEKKRLLVFDRGDHNSIFFENRAAYLDAVREFIAALG